MTARASNNIPPLLRKVWQEEERRSMASKQQMFSGKAIVSRDTLANKGWKMEEVTTRAIRDDELIVEMVASGICHTDILVGSLPDGVAPLAFYPRVLGHEGICSQ